MLSSALFFMQQRDDFLGMRNPISRGDLLERRKASNHRIANPALQIQSNRTSKSIVAVVAAVTRTCRCCNKDDGIGTRASAVACSKVDCKHNRMDMCSLLFACLLCLFRDKSSWKYGGAY